MAPAVGFLVLLLGIVVVSQIVVGDAVARVQSYADPSMRPRNDGPRGSVTTRYKGVKYSPGVVKGDGVVPRTIAPALQAAGGGWRVISWVRPGSKVAGSGSPSCHRGARGSGSGAWDIQPDDFDWRRADRLVIELRQTPGVGEVIFRGDSDHDPALGADPPHVHVAVNCG
jgi:hypothetical protein